jgi:hypothetical protein
MDVPLSMLPPFGTSAAGRRLTVGFRRGA